MRFRRHTRRCKYMHRRQKVGASLQHWHRDGSLLGNTVALVERCFCFCFLLFRCSVPNLKNHEDNSLHRDLTSHYEVFVLAVETCVTSFIKDSVFKTKQQS